jgi:hypothetical protein
MPEDDKQQDKPFTVNDRRRFSATGATRDESDQTSGPAVEAGRASGTEAAADPVGSGLTFSGFVIGLAQQAFVSLGLVKDPQTSTVRKDLPQAKAMIDVLSMLRDKTRGNLDEVESRMMDEMLDELRLRYVREAREARKS